MAEKFAIYLSKSIEQKASNKKHRTDSPVSVFAGDRLIDCLN